MPDTVIRPQPQPRPQPAQRIELQEVPRLNRGAVASVGFLAGWTPVICCSIGVVPAIFTGLGLGSAFFAVDRSMLWGFGMEPVLVLASALLILAASYVVTRPAFATYPRAIAMRSFRRTVGYMALAAGITFIIWMQVVMPLLFVIGVPMGALSHHM